MFYNFTINDLKVNKDVKCYVWYEGEEQRGVNESSTCIQKFLQYLVLKAITLNKPIDVVFHSDKKINSWYLYIVMGFKN